MLNQEKSSFVEEFSQDYMCSQLFQMLDRNDEGKISHEDLTMCAKAMGWSEQQTFDFLQELDPNHDGTVSEEEFTLIIKYIQQYATDQKPKEQGSVSQSYIN